MAQIGNDISIAADLLSAGKLVGIPTETVYGLAGDATQEDAILQIFKTKNRPKFDPLIAHVSSIDRARELVTDIPDIIEQIMKDSWPGPLTVLLEKNNKVSDLLTSGSPRIAIRMPRHPLTLELLDSIDFPLAAPSANPFGYVSPTSARHVADQLGDKIDYILDGGSCQVGVESTIIGMDKKQLTVYRLGGVPVESLELYAKVKLHLNQSSNPQAPGMIKSHYAPSKKIIVGQLASLIANSKVKEFGVISFQKNYPEAKQCIRLSPTGSVEEAAKHLFDALRVMDDSDVPIIYSEWVPDHGLGKAINDRLKRAAAR